MLVQTAVEIIRGRVAIVRLIGRWEGGREPRWEAEEGLSGRHRASSLTSDNESYVKIYRDAKRQILASADRRAFRDLSRLPWKKENGVTSC
jgi:hypothetical protein